MSLELQALPAKIDPTENQSHFGCCRTNFVLTYCGFTDPKGDEGVADEVSCVACSEISHQDVNGTFCPLGSPCIGWVEP